MKIFIGTPELSGLKKTPYVFFIGIAFIAVLFSCHDGTLDAISESRTIGHDQLENVISASSATSISEITFTATAAVASCYGEDIRFTGIIQNRVTKTTDASGEVHFTRSFTTRNMTGTGLTTNAQFDVLGGAEMFAVKDAVLLPDGSLNLSRSLSESDIVIHEGTLVFENRDDGSTFVARHVIRKVPGLDTRISRWECHGISHNE